MQKRLKTIATLAAAAFATVGDAAPIPQEWAVDVTRVKQYQFQANRGDTMELKATFWHNGEPFDLGGDAFRLYWQTNAMGSVYWSAPATAASNTVSAVFANTMDPGAPIVYGFLGATSGNYRASFSIRYAPGPGAVPNELPLPTATLDFAKVEVLNPPWSGESAAAAQAATNYTDSVASTLRDDISAAVTNLDARPVPITPQTSGRGVTFIDQYGENQNVAVAIGAGAQAAVTTNAVEAAPDNKVIRSAGVAVGGHAEVRNDADPLKVQGVAVGWHATVSAINGVAIGSGAVHPGDNDATVASAAKALAIGYGAKASAADAVQLGEGENTEAGTLKYRNVTVVKDGKVAADPAVTNALARHEAEIDAIKTDYAQLYFDESNGVKRVTIQNDAATFQVITDTNRADGVALTMGDAEIYGTAAIDRKLADKADVTRLGLPVGTTQDVWVCNWTGEILPFRLRTGPMLVWQKEYNSVPSLMYIAQSGVWRLNTQGSTLLTVSAAATASALDFGNGFTLTRKCWHPVAYTDDIPPAVSNTVTKAYIESLGITSEESDPTVPAWAKAAQKPSYTAAEVGATTPGDVTAMIRAQSLGGIWDQDLEVWWTPVMANGSLTYQATTNVNLNAEH